MKRIAAVLVLAAIALGSGVSGQRPTHSFALGKDDFLLDGAPFQMIGCEMHPARIPAEYWAHRIRMAKAMGCNTIGAYLFWNYHETAEGVFDFTTGNRDVARFVRLAQAEGLWVLLRPGPYVCAEWDFGGIPVYLLRYPDLKVRCMNPQYMQAAERYIQRLAAVVKPLMVASGGPIVMVQIENEYGSYGNDRAYMDRLKEVWVQAGIAGPFYTADGPTPYMLEAGHVAGAAVGLDSGSEERHWALARSIVPGVPVFSSETYPGWLTHWGEAWARPALDDLLKEVTFLLANRKSFNFYVAHGGTNFGFTAGANSGGKGYEPDLTSYDYDAPIDEQGRATAKYHALRKLIGSYLPAGQPLPPVPGADPVDRRARVRHAPPRVDLEPPAGADGVGPAEALRGVRPEPGTGALPDDARGPQVGPPRHHRPARLRQRVRGRHARRHARPEARGEVDRVASHRQPDARRRHPRRGHGPHQLRAGDDRPQGHHRPRDAAGHDAHELGGVPAAALRRVGVGAAGRRHRRAPGHVLPRIVHARAGPPTRSST